MTILPFRFVLFLLFYDYYTIKHFVLILLISYFFLKIAVHVMKQKSTQ